MSQWLYYDQIFNHRYKARLWPTPAHKNLVIQVIGTGETNPFSCLMSNVIPDLHVLAGGQCHPLYYYEKVDSQPVQPNLDGMAGDVGAVQDGYVRRDAITDDALRRFQDHYNDLTITKEAIFYYVYGLLHSKEYRKRYAADLKKDAARIPLEEDFWTFSNSGKALGALHTGFEDVEPYPLEDVRTGLDLGLEGTGRVQKMRFEGTRGQQDLSTIVVNDHLKLAGIPEEAHRYLVNGKPALSWVMERFQYTVDSDTGIINDPNEWSDDPNYITNLIKKVVTVSVQTMKIVDALPKLHKPKRDS